MATVCPTVTAEDLHVYRQQLQRLEPFAERIHLDFMDGLFTTNKSVDLDKIWLPENKQIDLHLMYMRPDLSLPVILRLKPSLVIVHAEAQGAFGDFADALHGAGIKVGVCLLQDTKIDVIASSLEAIDHVLIFSGNLGHFGGHVDLSLLDKAAALKKLKPSLELGWDGGINDENAKQLVAGGIDILNVGGFIQKAKDPNAQYSKIISAVS